MTYLIFVAAETKTTNSFIRYEQMRLQLNALVKMVHLEPYVSHTFFFLVYLILEFLKIVPFFMELSV